MEGKKTFEEKIGPKGVPLYIHNGFHFMEYFTFNGVNFLKCVKRFCHAKARIDKDSTFTMWPDDSAHSHCPPEPGFQLV
jgi:hypothetical protein